ncbi:peptidoglycan-binding protein [Lentibacillus jeotgali]|uniref:peptidoglycan-binding protein n=1 Tax=Lentibacillus jeotgali TaxID=558169 RepID=UPI000262648B|nr:peptidoglycan-binding protein [Lentibacillus jeotgali]
MKESLEALKQENIVDDTGQNSEKVNYTVIKKTQGKIKNIFPVKNQQPVLMQGNRYDELIANKQMLNWLGYDGIKVTTYFGNYTMERVKEFQREYGLPADGKIDEPTKNKLNEVFNDFYKQGASHRRIITLKKNLNRLGFGGIEVTKNFGSFTTNRIKEFQQFYSLSVTGEVDSKTINKMNELLSTSLQLNSHSSKIKELKKKLNKLGYGHIKVTEKFGKLLEKKVMQFQKDHGLPTSGIVDEITLKEIDDAAKFSEKVTYVNYDLSLEEAISIQMNYLSQLDKNVSRNDVEAAFDPVNALNNKMKKFQFLDLTRPNVTNSLVLDQYLSDKGILMNQADSFIRAGNNCDINEVYLVSQSLLAMDDNTIFASAIPVDKYGNITYAQTKAVNDEILEIPVRTPKTIKFVYNVYGIQGSESISKAAKMAFDEGWDTVEKSIINGAAFIGNQITNNWNTFYNIRWNPKQMAYSKCQDERSPVDITWPVKQLDSIYNIYQQLKSYDLYLEMPIYKN